MGFGSGEKNPNFGKHKTEEQKKNIRNALMGHLVSEETKIKIREGLDRARSRGWKSSGPKKGWKHTKESREKMSKSRTGKKRPNMTGPGSPNWKGGPNKQKRAIYQRLREARKRNAEGWFTNGEWELLKRQYGYRCPLCGEAEPDIKLTIDHVIPLSKGGSNWIENIQPLCFSCNSRKKDKVECLGSY